MKSRILFFIFVFTFSVIAGSNMILSESNAETKLGKIRQVIDSSIGWALNKDLDLLYRCFAHDSDFFIYHPDSKSTIIGFDAFKNLAESFFMDDRFKATSYEIKDLRINISNAGETA